MKIYMVTGDDPCLSFPAHYDTDLEKGRGILYADHPDGEVVGIFVDRSLATAVFMSYVECGPSREYGLHERWADYIR